MEEELIGQKFRNVNSGRVATVTHFVNWRIVLDGNEADDSWTQEEFAVYWKPVQEDEKERKVA